MSIPAEPDLFARERAVLDHALRAHADPSPAVIHHALGELISEYERVIRDMRRVISHSDRTELELNIANQRLRELTEALSYQNRHDGLTRLLNRNSLIHEAETLLRQQAIALILLDIDHFKQINDRYGHPTGDKVLTALAAAMQDTIGQAGHCGRLGGEEFGVVLATDRLDTAEHAAKQLSERIRQIRLTEEIGLRVTASLSVAVAESGVPFDILYQCTDDGLYRAKHSGRDRIETIADRLTP
ncbi:GGDEF domain-containing protein [Halothiobacillus sp. DCM-1]|uniref:GGDEF domain-containing protein n=1 Tax=Halothiobacillus sp. DCM-1 TaxID=3112558 RepID=UPI00324C17D5